MSYRLNSLNQSRLFLWIREAPRHIPWRRRLAFGAMAATAS
ncbi:hypothetical protein EDWATA_01742 [Edwardsiella tarda ATCC 23685]|uniref:Uncharacterized protein n=1 Tax=Edwardsiella tarda ATCC 23685 TaxID=500638 RepID=D4F4R9_EDWTA|nr:hypothetical protein EDWATA_01742 [Edwardsiella tarda ATCC 23685]